MAGAGEVAVDEELFSEVRTSLGSLLGAERRLRGRDQRKGGAGRAAGITHAHIRALVSLLDADEITAGALARAADLNPASVTPMIDHLEADGLIQRRRSQEDRRVTYLSLTPEGRRRVLAGRVEWQAKLAAELEGFSREEIRAGCAVMNRLAELLEGVSCAAPSED